jgi:hypothetical protein
VAPSEPYFSNICPITIIGVWKPKFLVFEIGLIPLIGLKFGTMLIKGYSVSVIPDERGRSRERKFPCFEPDGADRIPDKIKTVSRGTLPSLLS